MVCANNTSKCGSGSGSGNKEIPADDAAAPEISYKVIALCLGAITSAAWRVDQAFRQFDHDDPYSTLNDLLFISGRQACDVMNQSIDYLESEMKKIGIEFTRGSGNEAFERMLRIVHLLQASPEPGMLLGREKPFVISDAVEAIFSEVGDVRPAVDAA